MLKLLLLLVSTQTAFSAVPINCRWRSGKDAVGFLPCNPASTRGTCCLQGEACLESGLCYGSLGLIYRGACNNGWDPTTCLTYCDDKSSTVANIYACPSPGWGSSAPPVSFWCGVPGEVPCSKNGTTLNINPGLAKTVLGLADDSNGTSSATSPVSSPPLPATPAPTETANTSKPGANQGRSIFIGLGVGLGILLIVIVLVAVLWIRYHRAQKAKIALHEGSTTSEANESYRKELDGKRLHRSLPAVEMNSARRTVEVDGRTRAFELDSTSYI